MADFTGGMCPWCKTAFAPGDEVVICSGCNSTQHKSCREQRQACAVCGSEAAYINPGPGMALCAACGAAITEGQSFCPRCGAPKSEPTPGPRICGKCGAEVAADFAFCPRCGRSMGEAAQAAQAAPSAIDEYNAAVLKKHSRKRFKPLIATIVAVAVVAGISAGSYFTYAGVQKSRHAAAVRAASASAAAAQSAAELKKEQWAQTVTKDRADYLETAHDYAEKVYDTYPVLEGIGNEISKEWYDAIYNDPDFSISIDQAIDNAQKKEAYEIAQAKNINDELISDYNILQSPPPDSADFAGLTDDLSNMRDAYGTLYLTVILPAGNYDHYYSNVQNAEKTFVPVYNTLCDTLNNIGN